MPSLQETKLALLKDAVPTRPPYCSGTLKVSPQDLLLFYGKDGQTASRIDFSTPSEGDLEKLALACDPATFGLNNNDVLDESYRKAGKMDISDVVSAFDVGCSALSQVIRDNLLDGPNAKRPFIFERYKLNVYSKDSFFRPHKDTPRSEKMFGSLVLVLPKPHEGGALLLRDRGHEFTFDSALALSDHDGPGIAYIAFYSDVEHEVTTVTSGHRVTITYNLYFDEDVPLNPAATLPDSSFKSTFENLLRDAEFLPKGGILVFKLQREYVFSESTKLEDLALDLKGNDAQVFHICRELSLHTSLRVMVNVGGYAYKPVTWILCKKVPKIAGQHHEEDELWTTICNDYDGLIVSIKPDRYKEAVRKAKLRGAGTEFTQSDSIWASYDPYEGYRLKIYWATEGKTGATFESLYQVYGNESSIGHMYGNVYLTVGVGPAGARDQFGEVVTRRGANE